MSSSVESICSQEVEQKIDASYTMQTHHNIYLTKQDFDSTKDSQHVSNRRLDTKVVKRVNLCGSYLCSSEIFSRLQLWPVMPWMKMDH